MFVEGEFRLEGFVFCVFNISDVSLWYSFDRGLVIYCVMIWKKIDIYFFG